MPACQRRRIDGASAGLITSCMDRQKLARELADLPTSRLEQMYYPDAADWTEEARAIIRDALQHRQDLGTDRGPIIVVDSRLRAELLSKDGRGFPGGRRGTANEEATMLQLRVPRDLKQFCASALLVGLVASPAVAQPPPAAADSATQRETNFKAGFLNGCIKTKQQRGVDERYVRAYCLCAMLEFRAAMSETEFREIIGSDSGNKKALYDLPQFARGLFAQVECENVGRYDGASIDPSEADLGPPRRFDRFSIRLPRGFIAALAPADVPGRVQNFFRLHADLETAAMLSVGIAPATVFPGSRLVAAPEWYLTMTVESLKSRRWENWVHRPIGDRAIGSLTFKAVEWSASVAGTEQTGLIYVTVIGDEVIVVTTHDVKSHAAATLAMMQASMKTFIFYGTDGGERGAERAE